ncbi:serine hydrolase domain-containing protein [Thalassotalea fusca]
MNYTLLLRICLLLLVLFTSACGSEKKDSTVKTGPKATLTETLDTLLAANIADDEPGMIIAVWQNGTLLYQGMKGLAREGKVITENTGFRLASVSKTFTAIAVLKAYEQGLINLEDSVLDYMPELNPSWRGITIHHLLSHQSGIPDFANDFQAAKILPNGITNANIVHYFVTNPSLEFSPGTQADYSNTGYVLLAEIVARISGESFAAYLDVNVFSELGMQDSYLYNEDTPLGFESALNMASTEHIFGVNFFATGTASQISSMQDIVTFVQALLNEQILQPETLNLMLSRHAELFDGYGYGVIYFNPLLDIYGHTGGNDGFRTMYAINKEKNAFLITLGNGGDTMPEQDYIADLVGEFLE